MLALKAAGPNVFCSTARTRAALKSRAATRIVSNKVTKTDRFIDWILFEDVSHACRESFSLLNPLTEPCVKNRNWRNNATDLTSVS